MLQKKTMVKNNFCRTIIPGRRGKTTNHPSMPTVLNAVGLKHILIYGRITYPYTCNSSTTMSQLGLHTRGIYPSQMSQYRNIGSRS